VLRCVAACCSVLQCVSVCLELGILCTRYTMSTLTATDCNNIHTLQHIATHCNTLQHTATHCNILQHTTTPCNTLQQHTQTAIHSITQYHTAMYKGGSKRWIFSKVFSLLNLLYTFTIQLTLEKYTHTHTHTHTHTRTHTHTHYHCTVES